VDNVQTPAGEGASVPDHPLQLEPLVQKVDCIRLYVADLEAGLAFYRDRLGHELIWRTREAAGLRLPDSEAEIVLQTEQAELEVDLKVRSADAAAGRFQKAGGVVVVPPFDIQIGRAAVVEDPWGNCLVLLDAGKGLLVTDAEGRVIGNAPIAKEASTCGYDDLYEEALRLAARAHRGQVRKGTDLPYITHPMQVSAVLLRHGFPTELAIAGLLHDVVEDQGIALGDIERRFGVQVAEIVATLSERKTEGEGDTWGETRPWQVRKEEAVDQIRRADAKAAAVKAADTLHNAQSIAFDLRCEGDIVWQRFTRGPDEMLSYYTQIVHVAREKLGDHALVRETAAAVQKLAQMVGLSVDDPASASQGCQ
jgi:predicted enzyme related to lactoylglutathione lyase